MASLRVSENLAGSAFLAPDGAMYCLGVEEVLSETSLTADLGYEFQPLAWIHTSHHQT